ncbi:hypothetical protein D3C72_1766900 [compost metagenome]
MNVGEIYPVVTFSVLNGDLTPDALGNLYVTKQSPAKIAKVSANGPMSDIAGGGAGGDGGLASKAALSNAGCMAFGPNGAIYFTQGDLLKRIW